MSKQCSRMWHIMYSVQFCSCITLMAQQICCSSSSYRLH
jgi:hypothetical protein